MTERPILLRDVDENHHDVLGPNVQLRLQPSCNRCMQRLLLVDGSTCVQRDPDEDNTVGSFDTEVVAAAVDLAFIEFGDRGETVVFGASDRLARGDLVSLIGGGG